MADPSARPASAAASRSATILFLTVLLPFGVGYYMSYFFRTVNAIIAPQLVSDIGLTPADLGLMTSAYFIMFGLAQLPLGIVLDRYGPRRVQTVLLMIGAVGAAMFAVGEDAQTLLVARGIIGVGVSGCLMAALKANVMAFPRERIALVNGISFAFGTTGALSSTVPVEYLLHIVDWRTMFWGLAVLCALAGALIWILAPRRPPEARAEAATGGLGFSRQIADLKAIYGSRFFWGISTMVVLHNAVFLSYQSLWAAPWLRDVAGLDREAVADAMFAFNFGMLTGVLTIGFLAERFQKSFGVSPSILAGVGVALSIAVQCLFAAEVTVVPALLCGLFGYFGSSAVLAYAVLNQHFPAALTGRVNTAQNMTSFFLAFASQWAAGAIIGLFPAEAGRYSTEGHQAAFMVMIAAEVIGFVYFLFNVRRLMRG